ncbi:hypothetical protein QJQ45_023613 [Haematococcus lacustris]|nr:hypothetical protein QJQ45_023613 [Haematococcus lacustris]
MSLSVTYSVFPLTNYSFGAKEPRHERDGSVEQRLARLRSGAEREGLKRKLGNSLSPSNPLLQSVWDVGEVAGQYWRPNFDTLFYPYNPPHVSRPKECKKVFVVPLPEKAMFAVPRNMRLVAVPLFELYDNISRFGPVISALPVLLSKFRLTLVAPLPSVSISSLEAAAQQQPVAEEMKA